MNAPVEVIESSFAVVVLDALAFAAVVTFAAKAESAVVLPVP
jgi:hypothetical protein